MDGHSIVIQTYIKLIKKGNMTFSDIPNRYQDEVRVALHSGENNGKNNVNTQSSCGSWGSDHLCGGRGTYQKGRKVFGTD